MSVFSKLARVFWGLMLIVLGVLFIASEGESALLAAFFVLAAMFIDGVHCVIYYFVMARFMVQGWQVLVRGIIRFALVGYLLVVASESTALSVAQWTLLIWFVFSGVQDIILAFEYRGMEIRDWWVALVRGMIPIVLSIYCLLTLSAGDFTIFVFGIYMIAKGVSNLARSVRRLASLSITE